MHRIGFCILLTIGMTVSTHAQTKKQRAIGARQDKIANLWYEKKVDTLKIRRKILNVIQDAQKINFNHGVYVGKRMLAVWHECKQDSVMADSLYKEVLNYFAMQKDSIQYGETVAYLAGFYTDWGNYPKGIEYGLLFNKLTYTHPLIYVGNNLERLADCYKNMQHLDSALFWRKQAIEWYEWQRDTIQAARLMVDAIVEYNEKISNNFWYCQQPDSAIQLAKSAKIYLDRVLQIKSTKKTDEANYLRAKAYNYYFYIANMIAGINQHTGFKNLDTSIFYADLALKYYYKLPVNPKAKYNLEYSGFQYVYKPLCFAYIVKAIRESLDDSTRFQEVGCRNDGNHEIWYHDISKNNFQIKKDQIYLIDIAITEAKAGLEWFEIWKMTDTLEKRRLFSDLAVCYYLKDSLDKATHYWNLILDTYNQENLYNDYVYDKTVQNLRTCYFKQHNYAKLIAFAAKLYKKEPLNPSHLALQAYACKEKGIAENNLQLLDSAWLLLRKVVLQAEKLTDTTQKKGTLSDALALFYDCDYVCRSRDGQLRTQMSHYQLTKQAEELLQITNDLLPYALENKPFYFNYLYYRGDMSEQDLQNKFEQLKKASFEEHNFEYLTDKIRYNKPEAFKKEVFNFYSLEGNSKFDTRDCGKYQMFAWYFDLVGNYDSTALCYEKMMDNCNHNYYNSHQSYRTQAIKYYHKIGNYKKVMELSAPAARQLKNPKLFDVRQIDTFRLSADYDFETTGKPSIISRQHWSPRHDSIAILNFRVSAAFDKGNFSKSIIEDYWNTQHLEEESLTTDRYLDSVRARNALVFAEYTSADDDNWMPYGSGISSHYEIAEKLFDGIGKNKLANQIRMRYVDLLDTLSKGALELTASMVAEAHTIPDIRHADTMTPKIRLVIERMGPKHTLSFKYLKILFDILYKEKDFRLGDQEKLLLYSHLEANYPNLLEHPYIREVATQVVEKLKLEREKELNEKILIATQAERDEAQKQKAIADAERVNARNAEAVAKQAAIDEKNQREAAENAKAEAETAKEAAIQSEKETKWYFNMLRIVFIGLLFTSVGLLVGRRKLKIANASLAQKNEIILLHGRELFHRTKNDLYGLRSHISLAKLEAQHPVVKTILQHIIDHITTIGTIQTTIYKPSDFQEKVEMRPFLEELISQIRTQIKLRLPNLALELEADPNILLSGTHATAVGILVNEFLTNSFKHAFLPEHPEPRISIKLKQILLDNRIQLTFKDNGKGFSKDSVLQSIGTELIESNVENLDGIMIEHKPEKGVFYEILFTYLK